MSSRKIRLFAATLTLMSILANGKAGAADSFIIVSDVDDTVKITNVLDRAAAARNSVASKLVFAGMPELYQNLLGQNSRAERLEFISGTPRFILTHKMHECLTKTHFPAYNLALRGKVTSVYNYKKNVLQKLYGASASQFLLFGDDTESDPEVYANFSSKKPVLAIYIHRITGRTLPAGSIAFVTAFDAALWEYKAGRLTEEQAALVGQAVLTSQGPAFLPDFQKCPKEYMKISDLPKPLEAIKDKIENKMITLCARRR